MSKVTARILKGFDDETFGESEWTDLLISGGTNTVNMTWRWQRLWWTAFGKGDLLLILAEKERQPIALAPLFSSGGMIFNICPEDSLDFVGNISEPDVLKAILKKAMEVVPSFVGFRFYFIPEYSRTSDYLLSAGIQIGLSVISEEQIPSPFLDIKSDPEHASEMTRKKSLRRHENYFLREGNLEIFHYSDAMNISSHLGDFFEQHIRRRAVTGVPSIFSHEVQRKYYTTITNELSSMGWLRFTMLKWKGRPLAFHYGLAYRGRYLFGIPSFEIDLAPHSPGEVLLRQVLIAAIEEGAHVFDFGIGDEAYKYRFSTNVTQLQNWGMYPS